MYVFTFFFGHDIFEVCQNFIGINHVIILRYHWAVFFFSDKGCIALGEP